METHSHKIYVEPLQEKDIDWFVNVAAVRMLEDELQRPELVNIQQMYRIAQMMVSSGTSFIAKNGDVPIGALGSLLMPNMYNPDIKTLAELFWYVLPEYRSTRAGILLLNEFDKLANDIADEALFSLLPYSPVKYSTLGKRGYVLGEQVFRRQVKEI